MICRATDNDSVSAEKHRRAQCYETSYILVFASVAGTHYDTKCSESTAEYLPPRSTLLNITNFSDSVNSDQSGHTQQICQDFFPLVEGREWIIYKQPLVFTIV